jgi:hypothetical protein
VNVAPIDGSNSPVTRAIVVPSLIAPRPGR